MAAVMQGEVIRFDQVKGYGFIAPHGGGEDVFLHVNDLLDDKRLIAPGVIVEFITGSGERGLKATSVHIIGAANRSGPTVPSGVSPVSASFSSGTSSDVDDLIDVLTADEFRQRVTELLLSVNPSLSGSQILAVRRELTAMADDLGWIAGNQSGV